MFQSLFKFSVLILEHVWLCLCLCEPTLLANVMLRKVKQLLSLSNLILYRLALTY